MPKHFARYFSIAIVTSFLYFAVAIYLLNFSLVQHTIIDTSPLQYKATLLTVLLEGSWSVLSHTDFFLLLTTSMLVGINIALAVAVIKRIQGMGNLRFALGGGTMVGVVSTGCASCGFSAFSLFGASGAVSLLPYHGAELYLLAIVLLLFTMYYNIQKLQKPLVCKK